MTLKSDSFQQTVSYTTAKQTERGKKLNNHQNKTVEDQQEIFLEKWVSF